MPRSFSTAFDWMILAAAFGLLLYVLVSPTGSFVRSPMEYARQSGALQDASGFLAREASPAGADEGLAARAD